MKFKNVFFLLTVFLIATCNLYSQNAPITIVGSVMACPNDTIIIPVIAINCPYVMGISLELDYDSAVLSFINLNPNGQAGNFYNANQSLGNNIIFGQDNFTPGFKMLRIGSTASCIPTSVGNIAHLFDVPFRYYGGNTSISFNNSSDYGGDCEYYDSLENPYNDTPTVNFYINGTVTQQTAPIQPSSISGYLQPIVGDTTVYNVVSVIGVSYSWTAPSGWSGTSGYSSINYIVGSDTGLISVTPSNCAGSGMVRTFFVLPIAGNTIKGAVTYDNNVSTPLDSAWMFLNLNNIRIDSVQTDTNGHYQFNVTNNGAYNITASTHKPWGGVNSTDAVKVLRHFSGSELLTSSIKLHAADVNLSFSVNATDAVKIVRRFAGTDTSFEGGNWVFEKPLGGDTTNVSNYLNDTVVVSGNNVRQTFKGLCIGDVNGSYFPPQGAKISQKIELGYPGSIRLSNNEFFELPIFATSDIDIGAISIILKFPKELVTIDKCQLSIMNYELGIMNDNLIYNVIGDELRVGWFENEKALHLRDGEPVVIISGKTTGNFKPGDVIRFSISNDPLCEIADEEGNPIANVVLKTFTIEHSGEQNIESIENALNNDMFIFPNPAENTVNMRYQVASSGKLTISLFDILGEKMADVIDKSVRKGFYSSEFNISAISSGVYTLRMVLNGNAVAVKKLVISK